MSKRFFSDDQIKELLLNPNVLRCSQKSITYSHGFKAAAIKQWQAGLPPHEIFDQAGFRIDVIGNETPRTCLKSWRKVYKEKGIQGLSEETRGRAGGRTITKWHNDKEKIKYLEAKVAYLKAENDFLAKLRKKS